MSKDKKTKKALEVVAVRFSDDNVSALYIDGKLKHINNDYDDNADLAFENFIAGIEFAGQKTTPVKWQYVDPVDDLPDDFPSNDGSYVPEVWPDNKWSLYVE